jgi:hypothetical protein
MSNSGLFSNAGTTTFASNVLHTGGLTSFMSNSGLFSNAGTTTFASNVLHTGGLTSFMSNSGLFSNAGTTTFASNVTLTGGASSYLSNSGNLSNAGTGIFYGNVTVGTPAAANAITIQTNGTITAPLGTGVGTLGSAPYLLLNTVNNTTYLGGDYVFLQPVGNISFYRDFFTSWPATFSSTITTSKINTTFNGTANIGTVTLANNASSNNWVLKCEMTGANFQVRQAVNAGTAAVIENTGGGALLINPGGASVSIGSSNNSYMLDVAGIARSGIPVSSLTGTSATFGANAFGIYYYITNSAFSNIGLYNTSGGATGTGGTAPLIGTGWYVTLRNNTGSYLSITVNGLLASTPASPFVIPPANAVTIAYDANLAGGAGYVFF